VAQSTPVTLIDWAGVLSRGVLGGTFLMAGMAKFASPRAAATAVAEFGAPAFARPLLRGLPHVEVAVALSLAFAATAWFGAWVATGLLVVFIVAMLANLARGRRPACNCFGQVRPAPISALTVLRNVVLLGVAAWLVAAGPPSASTDFWAWFRVLPLQRRALVAVVVLGVFVVLRAALPGDPDAPGKDADDDQDAAEIPAPRRRTSPAPPATAVAAVAPAAGGASTANPAGTAPARRLTGNGVAAGTVAPGFALPDLAGNTHTLESLVARGKPVVLIFSSPGCESCQALLPRLPAQVTAHGDRITLVLVSRDTVARNLAKLKEPGELLVLRQQEYEVAEDYDITTSPAGIVVNPDGVIASPLAMGGLAILDLIRRTAEPADAPAV
jgi:hypothetical protein